MIESYKQMKNIINLPHSKSLEEEFEEMVCMHISPKTAVTTCWFGHLACKNRPRNDLLCVEWDVKPYTLTVTTLIHSLSVTTCLSLCIPLLQFHSRTQL